jgi:choline dehydrogenase-like flavoprotein
VPSQTTYDAIVVGSGIAGGWAAKELTEKGLTVLLLERGPDVVHGQYPTEWMRPWDFEHRGRVAPDVLAADYPVQSTCYLFGEATRHFFVNDRRHPYLNPADKPFRWIRGYHLGGRSLMWGRWSFRLGAMDFEANARDGVGVDWPVRYEELAPWYSYVERFAGISGSREGLPQVPDGEFLPPWEMNCAERHVGARIEAAYPGRRLIIGRTANLTRPIHGRSRCQARSQCERGCSFGAYFSSLSATLPAARRTGRLTVVTDAVVESVLYDERRGRASGVRVVDAHTREDREYSARVVFLCASTLGSTQIMLNSRSRRFPEGIANGSGALGRYLMDHHFQIGADGEVPGMEDAYYSGRRPTGVYVPRYQNLGGATTSPHFLRGYAMYGWAYRGGWARGEDGPGMGAALKATLREPGPWRMGLHAYGECLPRHDNYVDLADERDAWGIPLLRVHCSWGENEAAMRREMGVQAAEMLEAAGCRDVHAFDNPSPPGFCIHEMGTARMGRDPKTSVLNAHNQAHEVPNLFVTDGACMASAPVQNPSVTYMALTARAADYAVRAMGRREL